MHQKNIVTAGKPLSEASKALILLHGRGARASDILSLARYFKLTDFALLAPQATNNTWYPFSFIAPVQQNEPWLTSAIDLLKDVVEDIIAAGIDKSNIYMMGFSQGACLTLEFATRNATRWGGIVAFTGGLIGDQIYRENYSGNFDNTPVFLGTSDPDMHVPVTRVYASGNILREMGADVTEKIYPNMGHTIVQDEIEQVSKLIFKTEDED
jgi:phospholipase/carboxylesterase